MHGEGPLSRGGGHRTVIEMLRKASSASIVAAIACRQATNVV